MGYPAAAREARTLGYDALRSCATENTELDSSVYEMASGYNGEFSHRRYLDHPAYDHYMRIHKVLVGESGGRELLQLGDILSQENLPKYLDAAGSAYAEAALVLKNETAISRVGVMSLAEACWERSIRTSQRLAEDEAARALFEDSDQYRAALNIAYAPLMKALIVGNVTEATRARALESTLAIAQASAVQSHLAKKEEALDAANDHVGFLHECNTLLTLLHLDDPRYVPLPSFERADNGYYNSDQTHDLLILNQHFGTIKKAIPVEVKAKTSAKDRARYKSLLIRGKMHLLVDAGNDPTDTLNAFTRLHRDEATLRDHRVIDHATGNVLNLLRLYQKGQGNKLFKTKSATTFHEPTFVSSMYKGPSS